MIINKIAHVYAKALKRSPGYLEDVKSHSMLWNEKTGIYQITKENWIKMREKWKSRIKFANKNINSISKSKIDYCPEFEKPCCSRKTGMCKLTKDKCITNGIARCDLVKT